MKSILFNDEMVRAILDGRKTKTRRPLKPQPEDPPEGWYPDAYNHSDRWCFWGPRGTKDSGRCTLPLFKCPFGQVGGQIYVRETFCLEHQVEYGQPPPFDDGRPIRYLRDGIPCNKEFSEMWIQPHYRATDPTPELSYYGSEEEPTVRWKPAIHMPRWASRITLEITDIRIERLQEITEEDAKAEGAREFQDLPPDPSPYPYGNEPRWSMEDPRSTRECLGSARYAFANLWERLYAKKGLGWYANPWVWVLTFRRVKG